MRLGIILPNWVGDVVMATPALRALRNHFGPDAHLIGIVRPYVADVLAGNPWLDDIVLYTKSFREPRLGWWDVTKRLRAERLDQIVLLTNSLRTGVMAWLSGAESRVGISVDARGWLLTTRIQQPKDAGTGLMVPAVDTYLHIVGAVGCPPESPRLELATTAADERAADAVWKRLGLPPGQEVVVLNPGGAFGAAKNWPAEHFAGLANRIVMDWGHTVLINCGPAERGTAREIVAAANNSHVVSLADEVELPIGLSKACIRRARMLVSTDSGPRYFGIAFGKPVVTLFGPTDPRLVETHYERETTLALGLECQPCMARTCPLGHHRCMLELSVDMVYAAAAKYLAIESAENAA